MNYGYKPTTTGRSIIAACMAKAAPLTLTRVMVGSGMVDEETDLADVHELLVPVATGAVAERYHEKDRLFLTVQYNNSSHPEQETFYLSEFIVYAVNPDTGEEGDLLYATLGDYQSPVPAYDPDLPASVFSFPLILILSDKVEVSVTASPGIVTHDDLTRLMDEGVIGISRREITVPAEGWTESGETDERFTSYPYICDIADSTIRERMTPIITFHPDDLDAANAANVCATARTFNGKVRLFSKNIPTVDLAATLALVGGSGYIGPGGGGGELTPATRYSLGGVIIGENINVDADGRISVDKTTVITDDDLLDEDATEQDLKDILLTENEQPEQTGD